MVLTQDIGTGGTTSVTLAQELAVKGSALARGWMPEGAQVAACTCMMWIGSHGNPCLGWYHIVVQAAPEGLQSSFVRLASSLASVSARPHATSGSVVSSVPVLG
eukprot:226845-Amphidinium_carterae.1